MFISKNRFFFPAFDEIVKRGGFFNFYQLEFVGEILSRVNQVNRPKQKRKKGNSFWAGPKQRFKGGGGRKRQKFYNKGGDIFNKTKKKKNFSLHFFFFGIFLFGEFTPPPNWFPTVGVAFLFRAP